MRRQMGQKRERQAKNNKKVNPINLVNPLMPQHWEMDAAASSLWPFACRGIGKWMPRHWVYDQFPDCHACCGIEEWMSWHWVYGQRMPRHWEVNAAALSLWPISRSPCMPWHWEVDTTTLSLRATYAATWRSGCRGIVWNFLRMPWYSLLNAATLSLLLVFFEFFFIFSFSFLFLSSPSWLTLLENPLLSPQIPRMKQ